MCSFTVLRKTAFTLLGAPFLLVNGWSQPYTINTIAGTTRLLDGGKATSAPLRTPIAVAVDSGGNFYIADRDDNRIRKVTSAGVISTFAGIGIPGYGGDRGPAAAALINGPTGLAFDSKGNLYIADRGNAVVRRITSDGTINTVAGKGTPGFSGDNGPATSAELDPYAIVLDKPGNLYIADATHYRIRKVDTTGIITTIAGIGQPGYAGDNGPALTAFLGFVTGLALDSGNNLYIADSLNGLIRQITPAGMISPFAGVGPGQLGTTADGSPATQELMFPWGLAYDGSNNLYFSDDYTNDIRWVDLTSGLMYTAAGNGNPGFFGDNGIPVAAELNLPTGLAVGGGNQIFVADLLNARVRKIANSVITTVAGTFNGDFGPAISAFFNLPDGLAVNAAGNVAVADTGNSEARLFKPGGNILPIGQSLVKPHAMTVDQAGNFYVSDEEPLVLKIATDGSTSIIAGNSQSGFSGDGGSAQSASLNMPTGLAVDSAKNVYIADYGNHRVRKVDSSGNIQTIAGNGKSLYSGDNGPALSAGIDPFDVAVDGAGNLFVVDQLNSRIRKIATNGTITTVVGNGLSGYTGDGGPATAASLRFPSGIAIDSLGNLYIGDQGNAVLRRVTSGGLITTIAGNGIPIPNAGDGGPASAAQLDPWKVAVDSAGNVYVTDALNDRVRQLTPLAMKPAAITKVSGDNQSGTVSTVLAARLGVKVADSTGAAVPGVIVTFTVTPAGAATVNPSPAITLNDGTVTATVALGSTAGPITIQATATGIPGAAGSVSFSLTALASNAPTILPAGIASSGLSVPPVTSLSPNAIVSIFGSNFAPTGTFRQVGSGDLVNGMLPTNLIGVCAEFDNVRAPIFGVFPGQLNVQVPNLAPGNTAVQVITNCDTAQAVASQPIQASVQAAAPEFFYFVHNADGHNPIAAIDAHTGGYIGAPGLTAHSVFTPAQPTETLTLFATGFGATNPPFAAGQLPVGQAPVTAPYTITFGGVTLSPSDIRYVGLTPDAGLYQVNLHVPSSVPDGDQPVVITIGGVASPSNAFITVKRKSGS